VGYAHGGGRGYAQDRDVNVESSIGKEYKLRLSDVIKFLKK